MNSVIQKYLIFFSISKSTAFVLPIFFLYLEDTINLSVDKIVLITGIYYLLPLIFEVPFGIISDSFGHKKMVLAGAFFQIIAYIILVSISSKLSYHIYIILIHIAQCCFSGSESSLIKSQFDQEDDQGYKNFLFYSQSRFYFFTSFFILIGSFVYQINQYFPFILQILLNILGLLFIMRVPEGLYKKKTDKKLSKKFFQSEFNDIVKSIQFIAYDRVFFCLLFIGIFFSFSILINHKIIQSQIMSLVGSEQIYIIGIVFFLGNLVSAFASSLFLKISRLFDTWMIPVLILFFLISISYILMIFQEYYLVILGFIIINFFKSSYRPLISGELMNSIPYSKLRATILSISSLLGGVLTSLGHIIISYYYESIEYGNFIVLIIMLVAISSLLLSSLIPNHWSISELKNKLTNKTNILTRKNHDFFLDQVYPESVSEDHFVFLKKVLNSNLYLNNGIELLRSGNKFTVRSHFYGEVLLSDIHSYEERVNYCKSILHSFNHKIADSELIHYRKSLIPSESDILEEEHINILGEKDADNYLIHGDLHPANILIANNKPYVVDWDLCGLGPKWFDSLSLLSHPEVNIDVQQQIEIFRIYYNLDTDIIKKIFKKFIIFKYEQLNSLSQKDKNLIELPQKYNNNIFDKYE